ncbi:MAG: hypothetical protein HW390_2954 [Candidatus Brocadiaceae bacterium]|nr:hypothetical protein [Candidatus Brocadiaceae bacterium]
MGSYHGDGFHGLSLTDFPFKRYEEDIAMRLGVLILIAAVLISLGYSWLVRRYFKGKDSLGTWIHTLVSVIVAALIAIFIFYLQSYLTNKQNKEKRLALLRAELSINLDSLSDPVRKTFVAGGVSVKAHMLDLRDVAVEDAVRSGLFSTGETIGLYNVLNGIRAIRMDRDTIQDLSISSAGTAENIQTIAGLIETHKMGLVLAIDQVIEGLHIQSLNMKSITIK